jgi:glycosyltransferase involved in cell wall biosynthesis
MRILQVIPSYLPEVRYGGPIFATHSLCKALAARGHDVEVYTASHDGSAPKSGAQRILDGIRVNYFASDHLRRLSWAPGLAEKLSKTIGTFDIVHLQSAFLWPTWAASRIARRMRVPYVLSPRGMLVKEMIRRRNPLVKSAWIAFAERANVERAGALHVTSELEAKELSAFGWKLPPLANIPNGVDEETATGEISADVRDAIRAQPYALFFGRLSWKKGLDRLLRAFAQTQEGMLVIAGTDDEGLSDSMRKLANGLGLGARARILPRTILGADKAALYRAARVFVLPSYSENFGNAVLEAMAAGIPVVVTPDVGAAEIVSRSGGGVIAGGEPELLGPAIAQFMRDELQARTSGAAGRLYVQQNCTWQGVAEKMEALYLSLVSDAG